jgi:hypothetical protein
MWLFLNISGTVYLPRYIKPNMIILTNNLYVNDKHTQLDTRNTK